MLAEYVRQNYSAARKTAALETRLPISTFPTENPYQVEQILNQDFTP